MPLWMSKDKELRFSDMGEDFVGVNVFTDEYVIGVMLDRSEIEKLLYALSEYCGIPLFGKKGCLDGSFDDNLSS